MYIRCMIDLFESLKTQLFQASLLDFDKFKNTGISETVCCNLYYFFIIYLNMKHFTTLIHKLF